jgi:hypothetical protein
LYALSDRPQLGPDTPTLTAEAAIKRSAVGRTQLVGLYAS